jgi:hypothetical protein
MSATGSSTTWLNPTMGQPDLEQNGHVMRAPDRNEPARRTWMVAAATVAALAAAGVLIVAMMRGDTDVDLDADTAPVSIGVDAEPSETPAPISEPEQAADDAATSVAESINTGRPDSATDEASPEPSTAVGAAVTPIDPELPLTTDALVGYWTNVGGRTSGWTALFVDFRRDGSFTLGNTGGLGDAAFTGGTYDVDGDEIVFTGIGGGCDAEEFRWNSTRFTGGALDIDVTPNGGCAGDTGWNWVRVSPASTAGLDLGPGTSGATTQVPDRNAHLKGIWLRLETGDVLAIATDGSYLFTTGGDTLSPDDTGQVEVGSAGTVVFTSDGSGQCAAGDAWTWTAVTTAPDLIRDGNPRGTTMRTETSELCGSAQGSPVWRLLSPDLVGG